MAAPHDSRNQRFHTLDGMRGVAAILVMLYHFYSRHSYPVLKNTFVAVDFFFVLSGFVICHAYRERLRNGLAPRNYFASRIARLFPMAAIGLVIGLVPLIKMTRTGRADYSDFDLILSTALNMLLLPYLNINTKYLGNDVTVTGQIFPADDPLWSIFAELFASIVFVWLVRMGDRRLLRFCLLSLFWIWVFAFVNGRLDGGLAFDADMGWNTQTFVGVFPRVCFGFGCGVLLYKRRDEIFQLRLLKRFSFLNNAHPAVAYLLLLAVLTFPLRLSGAYGLIAISVAAPVLVAVASMSEVSHDGFSSKLSQFLGWISYPVYCLHRPVISFVLLGDAKNRTAFGHIFSAEVVAVLITMAASALLGWLFDYFSVQQRIFRVLQGDLPRLT